MTAWAQTGLRIRNTTGSALRQWIFSPLITLGLAGTLALTAAETTTNAAPNSSASCLECHSDNTLSMKKAGRKVSLFVDEKAVAKSAHHSLECTDCHENFDGESTPHLKSIKPVDCASCHENTAKKHAFHPRLALSPLPEGKDTACIGCHGTHTVAPVKKMAFAFANGDQAEACGQCHQKAREHFTASAHGRAFLAKQANAPDCLTCHREPIVPTPQTKATLEQKLAQTKQCETCHVGQANVAGQALRGTKFVTSFDKSVHGAALAAGKAEAANCVDCHGAHDMNRAMASSARMNRLHVAETCAKCHDKIAGEFAASVHAGALRKGNLDSPACTNCHGEHDIRRHKDPASPVHASNMAQQVCATCHASLRLTQKYGLPSQSFQTFADSYHDLASRGGGAVVGHANCLRGEAIAWRLEAGACLQAILPRRTPLIACKHAPTTA